MEVRRQIQSDVAGKLGDITVAVYDRLTGQTWNINSSAREDTASIVKLEIMGALLQNNQRSGTYLSSSDVALLKAMIEQSDNDAATSLWNQVGGAIAVGAFDQEIGMHETAPSSELYIPGTTLPGWGLTKTSAIDQVKMVEAFAYPNRYLHASARQYGQQLMEQVEAGQNWGVSAGVPQGVPVALKNGWLPLSGDTDWQVNSVGWIHGDGRDYVLAVLDSGNPSEQYGIDTIQAISATLYNLLG